jgi:hypothetical protein
MNHVHSVSFLHRYTDTSYLSIINSEKPYLFWTRGQSISTETVMQFTEEHVNKRFQVHRFLYCDEYTFVFVEDKYNQLQTMKIFKI